jgi:hypothetical protein
MTDEWAHPIDNRDEYSTLEILGRRADGTVIALRPDAVSPVLIDGDWWAIRRGDRTRCYRPVWQPYVIAYYDDLASRNAASSTSVDGGDPDDDPSVRRHRCQVQR